MTIVTEIFSYVSSGFIFRKVSTYDRQSFNISLYKSDENITCSSHIDSICLSSFKDDISQINQNYDIDRRVADQIQDILNGTDVLLMYDRPINITANIQWSANNTFTIKSRYSIHIAEGVIITNSGAGTLKLMAGIDSTDSTATVVFNNGSRIESSDGRVKIFYNPVSISNYHKYYNPQFLCDFVIPNDACISYMLVNNEVDLSSINFFPSLNYALSTNIMPNQVYKMSPIGSKSLPFTGDFDGNGFSISNILVQGKQNVGLFGVAMINGKSVIENVELKSIRIEGDTFVGALAGFTENYWFSQVKITGPISVVGSSTVGGLFGAAIHIKAQADIHYHDIELECVSVCGQLSGLIVTTQDQDSLVLNDVGRVFYENVPDLF